MFELKLRTLGLFSLETVKPKGMRGYREDRVRPFSGVRGGSTKDNVRKLQEKKSQLDTESKLFVVRVAEHGPGSLEMRWNQRSGAVQKKPWAQLTWVIWPNSASGLALDGGWTRWPPENPSNLNFSYDHWTLNFSACLIPLNVMNTREELSETLGPLLGRA